MLYSSLRLGTELGIKGDKSKKTKSSIPRGPIAFPVLGDWYAELFWCERRKCVLFVSETTRLAFVVLDVFRSEMRPLELFFIRYLQWYLKTQGLSNDLRDRVLSDYEGQPVVIFEDSPMREVVDTLVLHARLIINNRKHEGLRDIDSMAISQALSDIPTPDLPLLYPWLAARVVLGLEDAKTIRREIRTHNPLARRVGSPNLTIIQGGTV
jgi:hypothetical protein